MSITSSSRGNGKTSKREPMPASYPSRPFIVKKPDLDPAQLQLGNVTLQAVDQLTGMTTDEIERVAEQVLDGAEVTAAALRELAWRVHENGISANERLAHFVRVANQCADVARSMQQCIVRRDEQPASEPKKVEASAEHRDEHEIADVDDAPELGAVEEQIEEKVKGIRNRAAP